jgi:tetratricopeptide (TPR) repeat protein
VWNVLLHQDSHRRAIGFPDGWVTRLRRQVVLELAVLVVSGLSAWAQPPGKGAEEAFAQAKALAAKGDTEGALRAFRAILETNPTDRRAPSALYEMSQLCRLRHEPEEAIRCAQRILDEYPESYETRSGLASYRVATYKVHDTNDYDGAIAIAKAALAKPEFQITRSMRRSLTTVVAHAYNGLGDGAAAEKWLTEQLSTCPYLLSYNYYYRTIVEAKILRNDFDGALSHARAGYATCPFDRKSIQEMCDLVRRCYTLRGEWQKAVEFVAAQENAEAPNPLREAPLPSLEPDQKEALLAACADNLDRLPMLLYAGDTDAAVARAAEGVRGLATLPPDKAEAAILEVARVLKAADLNLVRANQFINYAKTGEGENPLGIPLDRHPAAAPKAVQLGSYALLSTWQELLRAGELDEKSFLRWVADHNIDQATLIQALDSIPLTHPMDPVYLPICATLREQMGENVDGYLDDLPYSARIFMATYLGVLEREDDAKKLLGSLTHPDPKALGADLYHVANELVDYRGKSPSLAIWAWKRGAEIRGGTDPAFVCWHIMVTCKRLGDAQMARDALIPWAEETLARPGTGECWGYGLCGLIWAYDALGESQKAVERGEYWLEEAQRRGALPKSVAVPKIELARVCAKMRRVDRAAQLLRAAASSPGVSVWDANRAQARLIELARLDPSIRKVAEVLPPTFKGVSPETIALRVRLGEDAVRSVTLRGNPTLKATRVRHELPFLKISLHDPSMMPTESTQLVQLRFSPRERAGKQDCTLLIETNDPQHPIIEVPITVSVLGPVVARPPSAFFGLVAPGESTTMQVTLNSSVPFRVVDAQPDRPELLAVEVSSQTGRACVIQATLRPPNKPGILQGEIELQTNLTSQPAVTIHYYAQVKLGGP